MNRVSEERVTSTVTDGVADVRLTRPDKHNALDPAMFIALDEAAAGLASRNDVRAVVLSGDGPSFCSGLDFAGMASGEIGIEDLLPAEPGEVANIFQRVAYAWQRLPMPTIAALQGACFGGGAQIALGADLRIAAPDTRISIMEIRYGLVPDMGATQVLPMLVRLDVAKELTFTGRIVEASEAAELGLLTRIDGDPRTAALALAREIAAKSPHAIRAAKQLLNDAYRGRSEEVLALEAELQRELIGSPNQVAAVTAAVTRQPAEYADTD